MAKATEIPSVNWPFRIAMRSYNSATARTQTRARRGLPDQRHEVYRTADPASVVATELSPDVAIHLLHCPQRFVASGGTEPRKHLWFRVFARRDDSCGKVGSNGF
ncbi:MAG: hypothetical protein AAF509_16775 [Pseudomonadota bacterium]